MDFQEQQNFENRVACSICLEPRLRMVTGNCQHRFCVQCVYNGSGQRKKGLERCPSCQLDSAFPLKRPVIPEDTIEIQRVLGVVACDRCGDEMWLRELADHQSACVESPVSSRKTPTRMRSSPRGSAPDVEGEGRSQQKASSQRLVNSREVQQLLADLESGMRTRSCSSLRCLEELDGSGKARRRVRSPPGKAKAKAPGAASSPLATEDRRQQALHPYRKK